MRSLLIIDRAENGDGHIQCFNESKRALLKVYRLLDHFHKVTNAAFTDGACDNTRPEAGNLKRRTTSYGVCKGVSDDDYMKQWYDTSW